jgi:hypothetical protein
MEDFKNLILKAEKQYNLPSGLLYSQMMAESNGNPKAVSSVGAQGLMQFMPATAKQYGVDPFNPASAIDGAGRYMKELIKSTGDITKAIAAYNWGIGNVKRKGIEKAPKETRDYVEKVTRGIKDFISNNKPSTYAGNGNSMTEGNLGESYGNNYQSLPDIPSKAELTTAQLPPLTEAQAVQVAQAQVPEGRSAQGGILPAGSDNPWIKFQMAMREREQQPAIATAEDLNFGENAFSDVRGRVQPMQTNVASFDGFGKGKSADPRAMAMLNKILSEQIA